MKILSIVRNSILDFIFPKLCYGCGHSGSYICSSCVRNKIKPIFVHKCHVCKGNINLGWMHRECQELSLVDGLVVLGNYDGILKKLIKDAKYQMHYEIMNDLGIVFSKYLKIYHFNNCIYTAVPMSSFKKKKRGFNQAEILGKVIGKEQYCDLLVRNRNTKTQVGMDREHRIQNLKSAFGIKKSFLKDKSILEKCKSIIIVDDVYTTGTTLNECAKILREYGFEKVYGVVLGRKGMQ